MGQKNLLALDSYTLMCRDHETLEFTYDSQRKTAHIDKLLEIGYVPLGTGARGKPNDIDLAQWIARRYMPALRPEARAAMAKAKVGDTSALMFGALGFNLSDQYWFRPKGSTVSWKEANFFENPFEALLDAPLRSPDSSTPGALPKQWECRGKERWLVKGSSTSEQREPYNERLATLLAQRMFSPSEFVAYQLEMRNDRAYSACQTLADSTTEFVSAHDVVTWADITEGRDLLSSYLQTCERLGIEGAETAVSKMIVFDYLIANFDRHRGNFGLLRNSESLDEWRIAPLFDNGSGFFSRATLADMRQKRFVYQANPFEDFPLVQVARAKDLSWYDSGMLVGFADETERYLCEEAGLSEEFAHHAARHIQTHIETIEDLAAERMALFAGF